MVCLIIVKKIIVTDASEVASANHDILKRFPFVTYLAQQRSSQVDNIDRTHSVVNTKYILHFEDDWLVQRGGFINKSIEILDKFPNVSVVSLIKPDEEFQRIDPIYPLNIYSAYLMVKDIPQCGGWGHFLWGPGLRRLSDYIEYAGRSYRNVTSMKSNEVLQSEARAAGIYIKKHFIHREWKVNWMMREKGFRVALLNDSSEVAYVKHVVGAGLDDMLKMMSDYHHLNK